MLLIYNYEIEQDNPWLSNSCGNSGVYLSVYLHFTCISGFNCSTVYGLIFAKCGSVEKPQAEMHLANATKRQRLPERDRERGRERERERTDRRL